MKITSQLAEDLFHVDLRIDRIKSNSRLAGALAMQLAEMLLEDEHGIRRDCYEKLRYLMDVLPVTDKAKNELLRKVDATDGRFYINGEPEE